LLSYFLCVLCASVVNIQNFGLQTLREIEAALERLWGFW